MDVVTGNVEHRHHSTKRPLKRGLFLCALHSIQLFASENPENLGE